MARPSELRVSSWPLERRGRAVRGIAERDASYALPHRGCCTTAIQKATAMTTTTTVLRPGAPASARLPLTANFHFIKSCDFRCLYCQATFADAIGARPVLPDPEMLELTRLLARHYTKVTFVGGEPTLYPRRPAMLAAAKQEGALTNLVTNGSRIDAAWLAAHASVLDLLTLSIDSDTTATHRALGRATTQPRRRGTQTRTVVTTLNAGEDITGLIRDLAPERWKVLQAAPVTGQNDTHIADLTPPRDLFDRYLARHQAGLAGTGIRMIAEPVEMIRGSYIMVDPQGRFFDSTTGSHHYSQPILQTGIDAAFAMLCFDPTKFHTRGGTADYATQPGQTGGLNHHPAPHPTPPADTGTGWDQCHGNERR